MGCLFWFYDPVLFNMLKFIRVIHEQSSERHWQGRSNPTEIINMSSI